MDLVPATPACGATTTTSKDLAGAADWRLKLRVSETIESEMAHQCARVVERVETAKENGGDFGELSVTRCLKCQLSVMSMSVCLMSCIIDMDTKNLQR